MMGPCPLPAARARGGRSRALRRSAALLILAGSAFLTAPGPLRADAARDLGLGGVSAFVVDDTSYASLPQVVDATQGEAVLNLAPGLDPSDAGLGPDGLSKVWAGTNIPFGSGALGVWFGRADDDFQALYAHSQLTPAGLSPSFVPGIEALAGLSGIGASGTADGFYGALPPADRVDLIYAFEWSPRLTLAVGLNRADTDESLDFGSQGGDSYDAQNLGLSLGCDIKRVWIAQLLQAGLQVNAESLDAEDRSSYGDDKFDAAATGLALRLGADLPAEGAAFGRAELGLRLGSLSAQTLAGEQDVGAESGSDGLYNAGYALGISQDRGLALCGLMLYGDFGGDSVAGGEAQDYSAEDLVFSAGGEFKICEWLTARGGFSGGLASSGSLTQSPGPALAAPSYAASDASLTDAAGTPITPSGSAQVSLGLGLDLGDLSVDGFLSQGILTGAVASGGAVDDRFGDVSAEWRWE